MIVICKIAELEPEVKKSLEVTIEDTFGHIPIVRETEWAQPDYTIIYYIGGQIASFYNIVERNVLIDNKGVRIAGINNVITVNAFRGKGYASKMLNETGSLIFGKLKVELGILLCAESLVPFYSGLGWYRIDCPVHYDQSSGRKTWEAETMFLSQGQKKSPLELDLNGLPW